MVHCRCVEIHEADLRAIKEEGGGNVMPTEARQLTRNQASGMERKIFKPNKTEFKIIEENDGTGYVEGYASVFGVVDSYDEVVEKGAFSKTIKERVPASRVKFVDFHNSFRDSDSILGVIVEAEEDEYGLWFKARLSAVQRAQDVRTKIKEGILDALSIGYSVINDRIETVDEKQRRYLTEVKLYEISIVSFGACEPAVVLGVKGVFGAQVERIIELCANVKEGRVLSEANFGLVQEAVSKLQALLDTAEPEKSTQTSNEEPSQEDQDEPADPGTKDKDHSLELEQLAGVDWDEVLLPLKAFGSLAEEQKLIRELRDFGRELKARKERK